MQENIDANLHVVLILTFGFAFACILGYLSYRLNLSPILGYLLAGYLIGPYSPGFVAEMSIAEQLAEIGVVLMMFGVGLDFKWQDLTSVKHIAIPGAVVQTLAASILGALLIYSLGWSLKAGIVIGLAVGVASTIVLVRVLADNNLLRTKQGHIAVGWLVVEDLITVAFIILIPTLAEMSSNQEISYWEFIKLGAIIAGKFALLAIIMLTIGRQVAGYVLTKIEATRSKELFTVGVLAVTFIVATGSAIVFGTSIALGAFIAGLVVGQTKVRHKAELHSTHMKDAFVVIFFLSIGMIFNPAAVIEYFPFFIGILAIIIIVKPLATLIICLVMKQPITTALTLAVALAQIGEFSFILAESGLKFKILPDEGYDLIVACAIVSISINPLLFKLLPANHVKKGP